MNANEKLIHMFYTAFSNKDYKTMQECYSDNATFNDEVFKNLNASQVRNMWEMLTQRGKDLKIEFKHVQADEHSGSAEWVASYTFSKTNRSVVNRIKADFVFENGKIVKHTDHFNFYAWAKQVFGLPGILLGWTSSLKKKVQETAMQGLEDFTNKKTGIS